MNGMWIALAGQTLRPESAIVFSTRTPAAPEWEVALSVSGVFASVGKNMMTFYPIPNLNIDEVCQ